MKTGLNPAETILEKLITFRNEIFKKLSPNQRKFFFELNAEKLKNKKPKNQFQTRFFCSFHTFYNRTYKAFPACVAHFAPVRPGLLKNS